LSGGTLFAGLADRYPRRTVMVVCDLFRMVVAALMAIPGTSLPFVCGLIIVLTAAGGPFRAAHPALLPDVLEGERPWFGPVFTNARPRLPPRRR
jgi:hypothetical protein